MFGFTGTYKGKDISVMGSGMGMPSMGIYSYELFDRYGVENIIRIGSAGSMREDVHVMDLVIAQGACTDSNWASQYRLTGTFAPIADFGLLRRAVDQAEKQGVHYVVGNILSQDAFYHDDPNVTEGWRKMGVIAVEMETAALYMNAARAGKRALVILTVSDHILTGEATTAEERQTTFTHMMDVAFSLV